MAGAALLRLSVRYTLVTKLTLLHHYSAALFFVLVRKVSACSAMDWLGGLAPVRDSSQYHYNLRILTLI